MRTIANTIIGIGITAIIIASMMVDEVYAPMTNEQFFIQIAMIITGMAFVFVGAIVRIMSE